MRNFSLPSKIIPILTIALLATGCTSTRLVIKSEPSTAQVYIDGKAMGETSLEYILDEDRAYVVKVVKNKYLAMTKTITTDSREVITLNFELEPKRHYEMIFIESDPGRASVTLNDEYICTTPCEFELDDKDPNLRRTLKFDKRGFDSSLLSIKYKEDTWKDDNFSERYKVILQPVFTQNEYKQETGQAAAPASGPVIFGPTTTTIAPNNVITPSGPVINNSGQQK